MFTRQVTTKLKANSDAEFTRVIEREMIPLLRKQKGFRNEITFVAPERSEAISYSFWDTQEDAEAYHRTQYPEVMKTLSKVIEGSPRVETLKIAASTIQEISAPTQERSERVSRGAYKLYLERGQQSDALQNWLDAEIIISQSSSQAASH